MAKQKNKYISKRRNRKRIIKIILILIIIISGIIVFSVKSDYFTIKKVAVLGNPQMSGEEVKKNTEYLLGQNLLFIDKSQIIKEAKKNPYVENIKIQKDYPKQVNITIGEKKAIFYVADKNNTYVLSDQLTVLESKANIKNRNLVQLSGVKIENIQLGEKAVNDERLANALLLFAKIIEENPTNYKIDYIDVKDLFSIKVYVGQIEGRLGNDENLTDKLNKFFHVVEDQSIDIKKGYIDVGFDGNPVYFKE